jgi:pimeloyl-ACP methyl ester carboxylesterase
LNRPTHTVPVDTPSGRITVTVVGDGPAVLLLPGGAATSRPFYPHLEELLADRQVITFDRPGTGTSARLGTATLSSGAQAVDAVLTALGATDAVIVGQSLGGPVAIQHLLDHPEHVGALVLLDPTPFNEPVIARFGPRLMQIMAPAARLPWIIPAYVSRSIRKMEQAVGPVDNETRECIHSMFTSADFKTTVAAISSFPADSAALTSRLRPTEIPVVIISADRPSAHRVRQAHARIADQLGGIVEVWAGAKHAMHLQYPQRIATAVCDASNSRTPQNRD